MARTLEAIQLDLLRIAEEARGYKYAVAIMPPSDTRGDSHIALHMEEAMIERAMEILDLYEEEEAEDEEDTP